MYLMHILDSLPPSGTAAHPTGVVAVPQQPVVPQPTGFYPMVPQGPIVLQQNVPLSGAVINNMIGLIQNNQSQLSTYNYVNYGQNCVLPLNQQQQLQHQVAPTQNIRELGEGEEEQFLKENDDEMPAEQDLGEAEGMDTYNSGAV